jgi:hypothetical protein
LIHARKSEPALRLHTEAGSFDSVFQRSVPAY